MALKTRLHERSTYGYPLLALSLLTLLGGGVSAYLFNTWAEDEARGAFESRVVTAAASLNPDRIAALSGSDADLANPDYVRLKEQLAKLRNAVTDVRFYYVVQPKGSEIVILCDSEPADSEDYSPPGQVYKEVDEGFKGLVEAGASGVIGPATDRWGTWVSGLAPIQDRSGKVVAALGMDTPAEEWARNMSHAWVAPVAVSGLLALLFVLLFAMEYRGQLAARALRASEENFRNLFENSPLGLYRNRPEGTFIAVNPALAHMLGYDSPEEYKEAITDLAQQVYVNPEDRQKLLEQLSRDGEVRDFEVQLRRKDGRIIWARIFVRAFRGRDDETEYYEGALQDVTERVEAEAALRESERRLDAIIQGCPIPQFVIDREHRVLRWNKALEAYSGVKAGDVLGTQEQWRAFYPEARPCLADLVVEGDVDGICGWYGEACQPSPLIPDAYDATTFIPNMAGGGRWMHFTAALIRGYDGEVLGAIETLEDVDEAKRANEELERSETKFSRAFQGSAAVMSISRMDDGRMVEVNERFLATFGYAKEEVIGKTAAELGIWYDPGQRAEVVRELGRHGRVRDIEVTVRDQTGNLRHGLFSADALSIDGEPHLLVVMMDVTDRKKAENALVRQVAFDNLLTRLLGRLASAVTSEVDREIGTSLDEIAAFFGVEMACLLQASPDDSPWSVVHCQKGAEYGDDQPVTSGPAARFTWMEQRILEGEHVLVRHAQDLPPEAAEERAAFASGRLASLLASPVRGLGTAVEGALLVCTSEREVEWTAEDAQHLGMLADAIATSLGRKHAEEDRLGLEAQLMQAQRMESVGRLAGGVAHDFNNMLAVILGHGEFMLEDLSPESPMHEDLAEMMDAAERAKELTRQLLAFSRKQVLDMKPLNLNDIVSGMEGMIRRLLGEDVEVQVLPKADPGRIRADQSQMEQILLNLCVNARDAMPGGGQLVIETEDVTLDGRYLDAHREARPGPYVMLSVSDTGTGMDEATQRQVFEPFFTTKEKGKGTGLGLATVFGIVKQHEGEIWVYSELGHGTTFKVYLPREIDASAVLPRGEDEASARGEGEVVLVVEDEPAVRRLTCQMVKRLGYTVLEAGNPAECTELVRNAGHIDLLLTDVIMPGMTGPQVRDAVNAIRPDIKTLFMSGYTEDVIAHHGVLDAGISFISKPFTEQGLSAGIREALGE